MAEFSEVMKQAQRMCEAYGRCSDGCPWLHMPCGYTIEQYERVVMHWAKEHPEPQYPTWMEWLESVGILVTGNHVTGKILTHIPADIAKKLGIEPIKEVEG